MMHCSARGSRVVAKAGVVTRAATSVGPTTHGSARSCCRLLAESSSAVARQGGWRRGGGGGDGGGGEVCSDN